MGMHVDLKTGECVVAFKRDDPTRRMTFRLEKKLGSNIARIEINADQDFVLVPPNKQTPENQFHPLCCLK